MQFLVAHICLVEDGQYLPAGRRRVKHQNAEQQRPARPPTSDPDPARLLPATGGDVGCMVANPPTSDPDPARLLPAIYI